MQRRPIAYLDVDDTIIRHPAPADSIAAPGADEFLRFLGRHFEVRWLTRWCPGGRMRDDQLVYLAELLRLSEEELRPIANPASFVDGEPPEGMPVKWRALDWRAIEEGRPFVWIENALTREDRALLASKDLLDCYIHCDVTRDPQRLAEVRRMLEERFPPRNAEA